MDDPWSFQAETQDQKYQKKNRKTNYLVQCSSISSDISVLQAEGLHKNSTKRTKRGKRNKDTQTQKETRKEKTEDQKPTKKHKKNPISRRIQLAQNR